MAKRKSIEQQLVEHERAYRQLASQLAQTGYLVQGTVVRKRLKCGKPQCACHRDPARGHGPYAYWSTKVGGRTVSRKLSDEEASLYEQWIQNRRQLDDIVRRMRELSKEVAELMIGHSPSIPSDSHRGALRAKDKPRKLES